MQVDVFERCRFAARIGEGNVLEADAIAGITAVQGLPARRAHRSFQVLVQGRKVEVVLVHAADRGQDRRHRRLSLAKQHEVHRHLAERDAPHDRGKGDPRIGCVEGQGADQAKGEAPAVAAQGEIAIGRIEFVEDVAVAAEQHRSEAEQLDLLGAVFAGQHGLQVKLHARFRRTPAKQGEGLAGEPGFGDEGRQSGQQQDQHRPRRERDQQDAIADQGDQVLREPEGPVDQGQRAARRFAPRTRELVVELGILEVGEIQGQRLVENHHVDALAELRAQQGLAERDAALGGSQRRDQAALQGDQPEQRRQRRIATGAHELCGRQYGVDDLRADPGDAGRQQAGDEGEQAQRDRQRSTGRPDQLDRTPTETEGAEEAARNGCAGSGTRLGMGIHGRELSVGGCRQPDMGPIRRG